MANLITRARALRNLNNLTPTAPEETTIDGLIEACSAAIEKHCRRTFAVDAFDQTYEGNGRRALILRNYPITVVDRVMYDPSPVLRVVNTSPSVQRAWAKVSVGNLTLTRFASGTATSNDLPIASNATLTALKSAIDAVGSGWAAEIVNPDDGSLPSADLISNQGGYDAKFQPAELRMHRRQLADFDVDAERGILYRGWFFEDGGDCDGPLWSGGPRYWRVLYSAGYSAVPEDVQEACAMYVAAVYWQTKRDPGLASESVSGLVSRTPHDDLAAAAFRLLRPYRNLRV
jgi:hypothetical protein